MPLFAYSGGRGCKLYKAAAAAHVRGTRLSLCLPVGLHRAVARERGYLKKQSGILEEQENVWNAVTVCTSKSYQSCHVY